MPIRGASAREFGSVRGYLVPVKVAVQRAEAIGAGAVVEVVLRLNVARWQ